MALNEFLDLLQRQTLALRAEVRSWDALPAETLLASPEPGSWSAAQCLDHLNGYGDFYLPHMSRALDAAAPLGSKTFQSGWLGGYFARSMEPRPDGTPKSKIKAVAKHTPLPDLDAAAVRRTFLEQQDELLRLIEIARAKNLEQRAIPISIASWIRLRTGDVFRFLIAHNRRHFAQALRALAANGLTA